MSTALPELQPQRLTPLQRLELLCDRGTLQLVRTEACSPRMGEHAAAGDGVLAGAGQINGRPAFCFAQDRSFAGGSLGGAHAETIVKVHELAAKARAPIVGFVESAGARMQEGLAALAGYGRIFRHQVALSGVVPQISLVCGTSAGGGAYSPALTDFVIMTEQASMFLTGPGVIATVTGERVEPAQLGGARVHQANGLAHAVLAGEAEAITFARELLSHLPQSAGQPPPETTPNPAAEGPPDLHVPPHARKVYDIRSVIRRLLDTGQQLEIAARYARNIVCLIGRLAGKAVGVVANQPHHLGGVLDAKASQKAARFVRTCDSFGLPLIVLVDTPGFLPGVRQEHEGVIRHGAKLLYAFAESAVPSVTVVLRKAYGGAAIAMNSKQLGADYVLAWPGAQIGVMAARQAVEILHRREIAEAPDPDAATNALSDRYSREHLSLRAAAAEGFIDEVIAPEHTRSRILASLESLAGHEPQARRHGNVQL